MNVDVDEAGLIQFRGKMKLTRTAVGNALLLQAEVTRNQPFECVSGDGNALISVINMKIHGFTATVGLRFFIRFTHEILVSHQKNPFRM
jgi:hypothetical protein